MSKIDCYEDLIVWQKSHELVLKTYQITDRFPAKESFCLSQQLRRAVVSIPANISEGSRRRHTKELIQFLYISKGSLGETEYYLRLAKDLNYISNEEFQQLREQAREVGKMLSGLIKSLKGGRRDG